MLDNIRREATMPPSLEKLTPEKALKFVRDNMAFTGDLLDWVVQEIGEANSETYVAHLAPIKLHRKIIGPLKRKTRLKLRLQPSNLARLRFKNLDSDSLLLTGRALKRLGKFVLREARRLLHPQRKEWREKFRLDELGDVGLALSLSPGQGGKINFAVTAGVNGSLIDVRDLPVPATGKQILIWHCRVIDPADMVGWYNPIQLMRTGVEVFFSTLFGRHADYRLMEALTPVQDDGSQTELYYDFTAHWKKDAPKCDKYDPHGIARKEIWLDYVGDVGDGWNSTYSIAYSLAQPQLTIEANEDTNPESCTTKRGDILIFGGDQVYPIANRVNYKQRLLGPYETALESTEHPHPHAFAIPGNHDWYDSLVAFTRLFCQRRWFAGWQTDQSRSYFALKLPGHWWVLGTDVQLDSDIDVPQLEYFKKVAKSIKKDDRVIICTAEPHWVYAALYKQSDANYNENNLAFFEKKIIPEDAKVYAFIAGDQHHYRRFEAKDGTQKITAGGGGAFLHPTHGEEIDILPGGFEHKKSFPSKWKSFGISFLNLFFLAWNSLFGLLTGFIYMLTSWTVLADLSKAVTFKCAATIVLNRIALSPTPVFLIVMLFLGFVLFTDTHSKWYRGIAGPIHGAVHVFALFFIGWGATYFTINYLGLPFRSFLQLVTAGALIFAGGWVIGSTILGVYLLVSLNFFRRHSNEAFSALAIENWKNFLRIRIEDNGNLTIFPIGIRNVPHMRQWSRRADGKTGPGYHPDRADRIKPVLIEHPILFTPVAGTDGDVAVAISDQAGPVSAKSSAEDAVEGHA